MASVSNRKRTRYLAAASGLVGVGGFIGGRLVFHHGWRVRPVEEFELIRKDVPPDLLERGDVVADPPGRHQRTFRYSFSVGLSFS